MTSLPNLPTDNFYKFSFLGGLAIIILTSFFLFTRWESINEKSNNIKLEVVKLTAENGFLHNDLMKMDEDLKNLQKEVNKLKPAKKDINKDEAELKVKLNDKNYREKIAFMSEYEKYLFPYVADFEELVNKTQQYIQKRNQLNLNEGILQLKNAQLKREVNQQYYLFIFSSLLYSFGFTITLYGRRKWIRLQKIVDEKSEIELTILNKRLSKLEE